MDNLKTNKIRVQLIFLLTSAPRLGKGWREGSLLLPPEFSYLAQFQKHLKPVLVFV